MDEAKNDKSEPKSVFESRLEEAESLVSEEVRDFVFPLLRDVYEESQRLKTRLDTLERGEEDDEREEGGEEEEGDEEENSEEEQDDSQPPPDPRIQEAVGFTKLVLVNTATALALLGRNLKMSSDENHKKNAAIFEKGVKESIGEIGLIYVGWEEIGGMSVEEAKAAWKAAFRAKLEESHK